MNLKSSENMQKIFTDQSLQKEIETKVNNFQKIKEKMSGFKLNYEPPAALKNMSDE